MCGMRIIAIIIIISFSCEQMKTQGDYINYPKPQSLSMIEFELEIPSIDTKSQALST